MIKRSTCPFHNTELLQTPSCSAGYVFDKWESFQVVVYTCQECNVDYGNRKYKRIYTGYHHFSDEESDISTILHARERILLDNGDKALEIEYDTAETTIHLFKAGDDGLKRYHCSFSHDEPTLSLIDIRSLVSTVNLLAFS